MCRVRIREGPGSLGTPFQDSHFTLPPTPSESLSKPPRIPYLTNLSRGEGRRRPTANVAAHGRLMRLPHIVRDLLGVDGLGAAESLRRCAPYRPDGSEVLAWHDPQKKPLPFPPLVTPTRPRDESDPLPGLGQTLRCPLGRLRVGEGEMRREALTEVEPL